MEDKIPKISKEELEQANIVADVNATVPETYDSETLEKDDFANMSVLLGQDNSTDEKAMKDYANYDKDLKK